MKTHNLKVWPEFYHGLADGTKHTPGPWLAKSWPDYHEHPIEISAGPTLIADVATVQIRGQTMANARLIAAAPDLLHALERILYAHDNGGNGAAMGEAVLCPAYADMARHVIKVATGE